MISVCLATYNGEKYIYKQIVSILSQLSTGDELIISDDGSTDKTIDIIRSIKDVRVKLTLHKKGLINHHNSSHIYVTKNFESAISCASGDIIFLSDQDDIWLPDRVNMMTKYLEDYSLVMCNFNLMDSNDNIYKYNYFNKNPISKLLFVNLIKMPFYGSAMAFRKDLIKQALPFPSTLSVHDNWLGLIAMKYGSVYYINESLHNYRRHPSTVSNSAKSRSNNSLRYKISYRLEILKNLIRR